MHLKRNSKIILRSAKINEPAFAEAATRRQARSAFTEVNWRKAELKQHLSFNLPAGRQALHYG